MTQNTTAGPLGALKRFAAKVSGRGPWWQKTIRWVALLGVSGSLVGALTFFLLYQFIDIPNPNAAFQTQTTKVYYSDGKHVLGTFAMQDRENVDIDDVPEVMKAAVIAAEDRTFYSNRGIDVKGIIRAARNNATSNTTQGASTITQQYVKILYLSQEQSYTRKVKEAILSIKIHNQLSKKEILQGYLNTIYFGNGAYGVEVAARTYFDKPASELNYPQAAALAAIINSPSYYDPYVEGGKEHLVGRYNYVLNGMRRTGAITPEQEQKFHDKLPTFAKKKDINRFSGPKGYLLDLVQRKMAALEFTPQQIQGGGLRIVTTFDYKKQKAAVAAVKAVQPKGLKQLHTALVSVQPGTGAVRAMYGGPDYIGKAKNNLNWATSGVQPGSTFKAFAIIAALEDGYSLKTQLNGSSPLRVGPQNTPIENQGDSGGESFGRVSLARAAQKSINTAFVDLTRQMAGGEDEDISVGAKKIMKAAEDAGIPSSITEDPGNLAYVTALGFFRVPAVDMANAYATIAAGGKRADWYIIQKVTDQNGAELHQHKNETERTIPEDVAADTIAAMRGVIDGGTGTRARTICPTAGKTGTATAGPNDDQHVSSSWFSGYTPKLATAVMYNKGVGNGDLEGYLNPFYGGTYPAMTFKAYMDAALDGSDCGTFPKPANIKADKGTIYKPPPPKCDAGEQLNDAKTRCLPRPTPTPTPTPTIPTPSPTPTTDCGGPLQPDCPTTPPPDSGSTGGKPDKPGKPGNGWLWIVPLGILTLVPKRDDEVSRD